MRRMMLPSPFPRLPMPNLPLGGLDPQGLRELPHRLRVSPLSAVLQTPDGVVGNAGLLLQFRGLCNSFAERLTESGQTSLTS